MKKQKIVPKTEDYFMKVKKYLISDTVEIGQIYGLKVKGIEDENIVFELVKTKDSKKQKSRVKFSEVFSVGFWGELIPLRPIQVGGLRIDSSCKLGKGILFGGIDFQLFKGRDLEVEEGDEYLVITGIYQ